MLSWKKNKISYIKRSNQGKEQISVLITMDDNFKGFTFALNNIFYSSRFRLYYRKEITRKC